ncbi:MAG: fumarylacetoacetate hydrolase family protein [Acidimicrobiia bacterium]|nr:fumarylacetoacetate hydrolase family protein [Acidimicrobiia bacterium]
MSFRLANVSGRATLVDDDDGLHDLEAVSGGSLGPDPMAAVAAHDELHEVSAGIGRHEPFARLDEVTLGPPVPHSRHPLGIGLNYRDHIEETGADAPTVPVVFTKLAGCIVGPTAEIELRADTVDYEAEVVVVIGTAGRDIAAADAWNHVAGVTAGQDVSDRALQYAANPPHFDLGKSRDTFGPTGPVLVSVDRIADPDDIGLRCRVNGDLRQDSSTSNLLFSVPELIAHISGVLTMQPGDLVFTGTPAGVGVARGEFLADGDVVVTEVDGVGTMTNRCRRPG